MIPTKNQIKLASKNSPWDLGNKMLYKLCSNNFEHNRDDKILAKVWLIGRAYAVAIERRKNKKKIENENFYLKDVIRVFKSHKLDRLLNKLKGIQKPKVENLEIILETHHYLQTLVSSITDLNKRSFASKYLHFHLPSLFYIYDTRAVSGMRKYSSHISTDLKIILQNKNIDTEYSKFYLKCFDINRKIKIKYGLNLTTRQLDKLLIESK